MSDLSTGTPYVAQIESDADARQLVVQLGCANVLRIEDPSDIEIRSRTGDLWVTQFGDLKDHVLQAGMSINFKYRGAVVVNGLKAATCVVINKGARRWKIARDGQTVVVNWEDGWDTLAQRPHTPLDKKSGTSS